MENTRHYSLSTLTTVAAYRLLHSRRSKFCDLDSNSAIAVLRLRFVRLRAIYHVGHPHDPDRPLCGPSGVLDLVATADKAAAEAPRQKSISIVIDLQWANARRGSVAMARKAEHDRDADAGQSAGG
jgi:hypothetical protein